MSTQFEGSCFRGSTNCTPISNISSDDEPMSFICIGYIRKEDRVVKHDRFTHCWKNDVVDKLSNWDKRDIIDTISVMSQALSVDENIIIGEGFTEQGIDDAELVV